MQLRSHGVESLRFVATSATRDAANRQVFVDGIRDRLGVEPEVITGREEAELSFTGAAQCAGPDPGREGAGWSTSAAAARSSCWALPTACWPRSARIWAASVSPSGTCARTRPLRRRLPKPWPTPSSIWCACWTRCRWPTLHRFVGSGGVGHHHHRARLAAGPVPPGGDPRGTLGRCPTGCSVHLLAAK